MSSFFRWTLTFLLLLATFMECGQVLARYLLQMPVMWLDETIIFPAIWMYMLGCANASREDTQITARILPVFFNSPCSVAIFDLLARFFSLAISAWLAWHALDYLFYSLEVNRKTGYLFLPLYIGECSIGAGMILVTWYCALHFANSIKKIRQAFARRAAPCQDI